MVHHVSFFRVNDFTELDWIMRCFVQEFYWDGSINVSNNCLTCERSAYCKVDDNENGEVYCMKHFGIMDASNIYCDTYWHFCYVERVVRLDVAW
jgi:hypothetical protein